MTTNEQTIEEWAHEHGVRVEIERDRGAQVDDRGWEHHAYVLTLHVGEHSQAGIEWRQGYGIEDSPTDRPESVLDAVVSDALAGSESFSDFCDNFGYDEDSRKAYATWQQCARYAEWVPALLGGQDVFDHVAYNVQRG